MHDIHQYGNALIDEILRCDVMDALVDEQTQLVDQPVMDRQPVQFIRRIGRDVVVLLLLYNRACRGVKYGPKWLEVSGTR